ncbi:MAG: hypothetical protein F4Y96_02690 [Chloroflexi bacterium]|nr:hypothetical protein [Chloroflexota bacterium]
MVDSSANAAPQVPLMQGETVEVVFDAQGGLVAEPAPRTDALVVTNERVVRDGVADGARVVSMFPLRELAAMEVADNGRSFEKLGQGIVLVAAGLILGGLSWFILEIQVLSVILGGLPILVGIYMLTGWAFPDNAGSLQLYAPGHAIALPLQSAAARESVYTAMQRIYDGAASLSHGLRRPRRCLHHLLSPKQCLPLPNLKPKRKRMSRRRWRTRSVGSWTRRTRI